MGGAYSITAVRTSVRSVHLSIRPVHLSRPSVPYVTQMVSVRYLLKRLVYWIEIFIHRYIIIKCRSGSIKGEKHQLFWELWPFFDFEKFSTLKNGFRAISFAKISVLDSNYVHRYIIIKCSQVRFRVKSTNYFGSYGPFSILKNGFHSITFERISVLDSYFVHEYIM